MTEPQAMAFLKKLNDLCKEYQVHCDLVLKNRPQLEHICATINAKVEPVTGQ
jgi:hypothetical protein